MPTTHLLYLHGFRSSPQSAKAHAMGERVRQSHPEVVWWCPQLPPSPRDAMAMVLQQVAAWPADGMAVVGSSLGGFYACYVLHAKACAKAVLLNPAVDPARDLARHIGEQTAWHDPDQRFFFQPGFVEELRALHVPPPSDPSRVMAIISKGDEVLDWREMAAHCKGAKLRLLDEGDHALSDFAVHIDAVCAFIGLEPGA